MSLVDRLISRFVDPRGLARLRRSAPAGSVVDLAVENLKSEEHWGLAPHAPFTASDNLYRRCEKVAGRENVLLTTHLAESREEMSMFRDANGPLYDFLKEIGRDMSDCGKRTPLQKFVGNLGEASLSHWLVVHMNELAKSDFDLLATPTMKSDVVHCPRSHGYFGHLPFPFEKLHELGFTVCLGTDSLASNDDLSLFAEMRAFQKEFPDVAPDEILKMATVNSARALRQENALGKIRLGFLADLIAIPAARAAFAKASSAKSASVFEQIVAFDQPVIWSMFGGKIQGTAAS